MQFGNMPRIRVWIISLGSAVVLAVAGTAYVAFREAGPRILESFTSALTAVHSERCLTVPDATHGNDISMRQHRCAGTDAQRFEFTRTSGGGYRMRNAARRICVEVQDGRSESGARLSRSTTCDGRLNQEFLFQPVSGLDRTFMLVAGHSGKCLDVYAGGQDDGVPVLQWTCGDPAIAGNQLWRIDRVGDAASVAGPARTGSGAATTRPAQTPSGPTPKALAGPPATAGTAGTNPDWGRKPPPATAPVSRAYRLIHGPQGKGYQPRAGECGWQVHARYWTWGPDGKVYPTWHPPRDPSGCAFGHEHGDDPHRSTLFAEAGWPPFGYVNEMLAPSDPARQRDEDHVGHKVQAGNGLVAHRDNEDRGTVTMRCDTLIKFHQGTHSRDALTNNLHELVYNARCRHTGSGGDVTEARFSALVPLGHAGGFNVSNVCSGKETVAHRHVGPATPADAPDGPFLSDPAKDRVPPQPLGRFIPDAACAMATLVDGRHIGTMTEIWAAEVLGRTEKLNFQLSPLFAVVNPSRYYNPDNPTRTGWVIDLCYQGAKGAACDAVRRLTRQTGRRIAADDPRSPFNGANRGFSPGAFVVENHGPTTVYTDVFGQRFSEQPFPGAIKQHIAGAHHGDPHQGQIINGFTDYAKDPADRIHVPN